MFDNVYHVFFLTKIAFDLWNALDQRYATAKKGLVRVGINDWFDFQFVDNKNLSDQLHDFENLVYELKVEGVEQSESVYVASTVKKASILV